MSELSSKEKASLRSQAQALKPAVVVGKQGLSEGVVAELNKAFAKSELLKVAFKADRSAMGELSAQVEALTGSQCVGGVGKRRSFYRSLKSEA